MKKETTAEFGAIRSVLWPIFRHERALVIPMIFMLFFTCFNYSALKNLKDVIVITAKSSGGEVIPFIKLWAMLPMAVLSAYLFTKLSNRYSQEKVYYMMVGGFLSLYLVFGFVVYPLREQLALDHFAEVLTQSLPAGCKGFIAMVRHWPLTLFYVLCELWSSIVLAVLFWGFANEITKVKDASRFYSLFSVVSSCSSIFVGSALDFLTKHKYNPSLPFGNNSWEQTVQLTIIVVILVGLGILASFFWMNKYVLTEPRYADLHNSDRHFKMKKRQSLWESFAFLLQSKYLLCIAVIVVCYSLVMNLVEVVWKDELKTLYPSENDYLSYLGSVTFYIGIFSTCAAFFVGKLIAWLGWTRTALITPVVMLVTSLGFFGFLFSNEVTAEDAVYIWGYSPLAMAAFFGFLQHAVSKSGKYVVFDATKEMAFIPLDHDLKLKGKAAIDGVGSRLGKSGGAVVHQTLYVTFGALTTSIPYIALVIFGVIVAWMVAVRILGVEFAALAHKNQDDAVGITDGSEEATAPARL